MRIPEDRQHLWPCYRLVLSKVATWTEVTTTMSIDHVMDLNEMLTIWDDAEG